MCFNDGMLDCGVLLCCRTRSACNFLHAAGELNLVAARSENCSAGIGRKISCIECADREDVIAQNFNRICRCTFAKLVIRIHIGKGQTSAVCVGADGNIVCAGGNHVLTGLWNQCDARAHIDIAHHCVFIGIECESTTNPHCRALSATDLDLLDHKPVRHHNLYKTYAVVKVDFT